MKKIRPNLLSVFTVFLLLVFSKSNSTTLYWLNGSGDGLWSTPGDGLGTGNWDDGTGLFSGLPAAGDIVVFDGTTWSNTNCAIDLSTPSLAGFQITNGYTSTITQNATFTVNVNFNGTSNFSLSSGATFTGGNSNITISGTFTQTAGTFTSSSSALSIGGNFTQSGGTFTHNSGIVNFNSNSLTINNTPTFYNLRFTNLSTGGLTFTIDQSITVTNSILFNSGAVNATRPITLNKGAGNGYINLQGGFTGFGNYTGTIGGGTATIIFNGSGAQNMAGSSTDGAVPLCNLEFNSTTARTISVTSGKYVTTAGNLTISGAGGDITMNTGTLNVQGNVTITNTGTGGGGSMAMVLNGTGAQTIDGPATAGQGKLPNVTINKSSGGLTLTDIISVDGDWTYTTAGSVTNTGSTVAFYGNSVSSNGMSFNNVEVNTGTTTLSNALDVNGILTINGTLDANAKNMNVAGNFVNAGTFTHNSNSITFDGTTTVSGASTTTFYNVTISGTLTGHATSMNVAGNFTNNGTYTHNSGTIDFNGSGTQTVGGNADPTVFYNMKVSTNAHTVNMDNNANLVNRIDVTGGATFDADGETGGTRTFTLVSTDTRVPGGFDHGGTAAVGDLTNGTFNGSVVYQRKVDGFTQWRTLGWPITGSKTIADWDATIYTSGFTNADSDPDAFTSIYTYNAGTQAYAPATAESNIISADDATLDGKGFLVYVGNTSPGTTMSGGGLTLTSTGSIISGQKTPAVSNGGSGYNLLANPYPCPLLFSSFYTTNSANINQKYHVFNPYTGGFDTWDGATSSGGYTNGKIASGQGFFVEATSSTDLTFNEDHKYSGKDGNFLKLAANDLKIMRLTISSTTATPYVNYAVVGFTSSASETYSVQEDSKPLDQLAPNSPVISTYSSDGERLVINKMGELNKDYDILVRATVGVSGTYSISADSLINEITGCVVLEDKLTGTLTDLKTNNSYTFTISDTTKAPRFVLHISGTVAASFTSSATNVPVGTPVNFTSTSTGATSYNWNFGDGNSSIVSAPSHSYTTAGTYTVTLTASSSCGQASSTQVIIVESPLGIAQSLTENTMNIINNGNNGIYLSMNYNHRVAGTIEIVDLLGKSVASQAFSGDKKLEPINTSNVKSSGIYLIRVLSTEKTFTQKLFISN